MVSKTLNFHLCWIGEDYYDDDEEDAEKHMLFYYDN
jgi:hypothetical protein